MWNRAFLRWYIPGYSKRMKTAISIPDSLFQAAEQGAARRKVSGSRFYSVALAACLKSLRAKKIKKALDAVYATGESELADASGSEPGYRRPVAVVPSNEFNESRIRTVVVTLTTHLGLAAAQGNVLC